MHGIPLQELYVDAYIKQACSAHASCLCTLSAWLGIRKHFVMRDEWLTLEQVGNIAFVVAQDVDAPIAGLLT
jgi:hypothetical protein